MATIILHRSPFGTGATDYDQFNGSLIDWLQGRYPNGFGVPITVTLNEEPLSLENLDIHLLESDVVEITVQPMGEAVAGYLLNAIIALAVSYVVARIFGPKPPKNPGFAESPQPSPIYSVAVAQNATRIGEAIPVLYGEVLTTPDYAAQPYLGYTEVALVDASAPPGYLIQYLDVNNAQIGFATTTWLQGFLHYLHPTIGWTPVPTGSATPGYVEGTFWMIPGFYGNGQSFSPNQNALDPAAIRLDLVKPPGTASYLINNSQASGTVNIQRQRGNNGDQYLCALLCIGCGEFQTVNPADIKIGNTTLDMLDPATYTAGVAIPSTHGSQVGPISFLMALSTPAGVPTYWENTLTALEVGDQELIAANDETLFFPIGDKDVTTILVDIAFPRGLFKINAAGVFQFIAVTIEIHIQIKQGANWIAFLGRTVTFTNNAVADVSPWRRSLSIKVSPGVYRVKIRRVTAAAPTDGSVSDAFQWIGLRGFIAAPVPNYAYGNVSLLAVRVRANNLLSENATSRIQARVRRLIPGIGFTGSPAYCVKDIMENTDYGAERPPNVDIDWPLFAALHTRWNNQGDFNGGFTERVTVWEALTSVLTPGVAQPVLIGGQVSARYEGVRSTRVQLFTDANIVQNSLSVAYSFRRVGDSNGFTVEYRNPNNWLPEFVTYPQGATNPEKVSAFGVRNSFLAALYATFLHQRREFVRRRIRFDVELEGNVPVPGDRIGVQQSLINATSGGRVIAYSAGPRTITLENPFVFAAGVNYAIVLRDQYGVPSLPQAITPVDSTHVNLVGGPPMTIYSATDDSPTLYAVGELSQAVWDWLVDAVTQAGENTFTIDATVYDARIYQNSFPFLLTEI